MKMGLGISRLSSLVPILFSIVVMGCCLIAAEGGDDCQESGKLPGKNPPPGKCKEDDNSKCCAEGESYSIFQCSPPVTEQTKAILTLNSFQEGGDGGGPSKCDNMYHSDDEAVVALSTGWFGSDDNNRCHNSIIISSNGKEVKATVVDECDSTQGCDEEHDFQRPCRYNVVDASKAVWKALAVDENGKDEPEIEWSEA
ncbi:putative ripening-related protein 1 [Neltuma alba]|uniref:putative ripening-related protein 1 n=1 Tax=Neltuma alba TaxID=207710 RepID=UPI0010A317D7|nr:putative ripening-related protein 1 [Prosopis alba]